MQLYSYGPQKWTYHNADGAPVINTAKFPDMVCSLSTLHLYIICFDPLFASVVMQLEMTNFGHSLNLTVGWYGLVHESESV